MFVVTFIFDDRFHIEKENYFLRSNVFYSPDQSVLDLFLLSIPVIITKSVFRSSLFYLLSR